MRIIRLENGYMVETETNNEARDLDEISASRAHVAITVVGCLPTNRSPLAVPAHSRDERG